MKVDHRDVPWERTYLRRRGRTTKGQARALRELWPRFGREFSHDTPLVLDFGREGPLVVDVGFGHGDSLVALAQCAPHANILGIEVHVPGLGGALLRLEEHELQQVRLVRGDALWVLRDQVKQPIDTVYVGFPDPWPTEHRADRRLVGTWLLDILQDRLRPGGWLYVATDVDIYAEHVKAMLQRDGWHDRTGERPSWRVQSLYEQRGREAGHTIHDLAFQWGEGAPSALSPR